MARLYADLHVHPTLYAFNHMRNSAAEDDPERFHPWQPMAIDRDKREAGAHAATYTQASFAKLARSKTRLAFVSFTPIEKGFFETSEGENRHPFAWEALRLMSGTTVVKGGLRWLLHGGDQAKMEFSRILRNRGPVRMALQMLYLRYGLKRVRHIVSKDFDYWDEYVRELDFLRGQDGQRHEPAAEPGGDDLDPDVAGCYHIIRSAEQLQEVIEGDADIAAVVTIEGSHVFSIGPDLQPVSFERMQERIAALKAQPEPVLFITLAHHFDNGFCGHAHSLPDVAKLVMDQRERLYEGFERKDDLGIRVALELLDLDGELNDRGGRRILLDIKHMSPLTRRQYYDEIVRPYNERVLPAPIPIVASHVGYSGVGTLQELIDNAQNEDDHWFVGNNYAWGINLCDEDVRMIHDSRGLLGVIFDRRVAGTPPDVQIPEVLWKRVIADQILGFVDAVMLDDRRTAKDRRRVWDCISLGTDYDGVMHPVPRYPTVMEFPLFADDLARVLHGIRHTRMIEDIGVDELVEKICWRNAYEFTLRNFPTK